MVLGGFQADGELLGYLLVARALCHELKNFPFAGRQPLFRTLDGRVGEGFLKDLGHGGSKVGRSRRDGIDGFDQNGKRGGFLDDTAGADFEGAADMFSVQM